MLFVMAVVGCTGEAELPEGEGTLRVGLWGDGASGTTYSLRDASFHVTGNGVDLTMFTAGLPDGTASITTPLAAGDYQIVLDPGWTVFSGDVGDPMPIAVDAELASDNPVPFAIADNLSTEVTFVFDVDGELVPMNQGTLDVDVEFQEDDGVCTPTFVWEELFVSTGDYIDHGDGWQGERNDDAPKNGKIVGAVNTGGLFQCLGHLLKGCLQNQQIPRADRGGHNYGPGCIDPTKRARYEQGEPRVS